MSVELAALQLRVDVRRGDETVERVENAFALKPLELVRRLRAVLRRWPVESGTELGLYAKLDSRARRCIVGSELDDCYERLTTVARAYANSIAKIVPLYVESSTRTIRFVTLGREFSMLRKVPDHRPLNTVAYLRPYYRGADIFCNSDFLLATVAAATSHGGERCHLAINPEWIVRAADATPIMESTIIEICAVPRFMLFRPNDAETRRCCCSPQSIAIEQRASAASSYCPYHAWVDEHLRSLNRIVTGSEDSTIDTWPSVVTQELVEGVYSCGLYRADVTRCNIVVSKCDGGKLVLSYCRFIALVVFGAHALIILHRRRDDSSRGVFSRALHRRAPAIEVDTFAYRDTTRCWHKHDSFYLCVELGSDTIELELVVRESPSIVAAMHRNWAVARDLNAAHVPSHVDGVYDTPLKAGGISH